MKEITGNKSNVEKIQFCNLKKIPSQIYDYEAHV